MRYREFGKERNNISIFLVWNVNTGTIDCNQSDEGFKFIYIYFVNMRSKSHTYACINERIEIPRFACNDGSTCMRSVRLPFSGNGI